MNKYLLFICDKFICDKFSKSYSNKYVNVI